MTVSRASSDMLKLEDAVRYPRVWSKAILITVTGVAMMIVFDFALRIVWVSVLVGLVCWCGGTALLVAGNKRLMNVATRIFRDHPEYTAQDAANAARRELGLRELRYP